jgi:hypothetical protein
MKPDISEIYHCGITFIWYPNAWPTSWYILLLEKLIFAWKINSFVLWNLQVHYNIINIGLLNYPALF